jgi:hypothetical protein
MADHLVKIRQSKHEVGTGDVVFEIFTEDDGKLGDLRISRGGVVWWPKAAKTGRSILRRSSFRRGSNGADADDEGDRPH